MIGSFLITAVQKRIAGDKHDKVAHLTFRDLLTAFAAAVEANDGEGLASLFTEDGTMASLTQTRESGFEPTLAPD
jgi:ketosteroid isomerase-like protein